jgi:hypothetical protein
MPTATGLCHDDREYGIVVQTVYRQGEGSSVDMRMWTTQRPGRY